MNQFLNEVWKLWYWAMFCPSKLKERINELAPQERGNTRFSDILLFSKNWNIVNQFLFLIATFCIPLIGLLWANKTLLDWILIPLTLVVAYALACFSFSVGIHTPLLFTCIYATNASSFNKHLRYGLSSINLMPSSTESVLLGIAIYIFFLCLTAFLSSVLVEKEKRLAAKVLFIFGVSFSIGIGSSVIIKDISAIILLCAIFSGIAAFLWIQLEIDPDVFINKKVIAFTSLSLSVFTIPFLISFLVSTSISVVLPSLLALIVGVSVALAVTFICLVLYTALAQLLPQEFVFLPGNNTLVWLMLISPIAMVLASIIALIVVSIFELSLIPFLVFWGILAFSLSPIQIKLTNPLLFFVFYIPITFLFLLKHSLMKGEIAYEDFILYAFWIAQVGLVFYFRLLPEYLLFAPVSVTANAILLEKDSYRVFNVRGERLIRNLPPFRAELLSLPLPGHAHLLAKVFEYNTNFGMAALRRMQILPAAGLRQTAQRALPDIVASELLKINTTQSICQLLSRSSISSKNLFQILLPTYYESLEDNNIHQAFSKSDLNIIFPRLQIIAQDLDAAMQAKNSALKQRGLERIVDQLELLDNRLPGLELSSNAIKRWQPVVNSFRTLLTLELISERKLSQGELFNPFQYGNPLKRVQNNLFKGRQAFADNIVRLLLDRNRPTIVLHGPRRCGKTSFLNNLPRLLPGNWLPVFIDIQSSAATADETSFLRSLARAIRRDSGSQGLQLPPVPERDSFIAAPYDTFETWLENVLDQLGDRQLLLNLDEFEKIGTAINQGKLSLSLFDELRSLIQHWDRLGFIFSGVQTLDEIGPNWSSYFISVVPVEMLYLEPNEARDLLTNPDPEFALAYESGLVDTILEITQCHPNLLQLLGAALVTEANEGHTQTATANMLEAAIPRAFTLGTSYFTNVWTEFTGDPTKSGEVRAGQIVLKTLADGNQPIANDTATKAALRRMVRYHVLKENNGQYEFDIPLIKRWVKERAILDDST